MTAFSEVAVVALNTAYKSAADTASHDERPDCSEQRKKQFPSRGNTESVSEAGDEEDEER